MPEKKRQHYVPRSYLRRFAIPGRGDAVRVLRLGAWVHVEQASIATTCQDPYLYGRDGTVETHLQPFEDAGAQRISSIVAGDGVPQPDTEDERQLLRYVGLQWGRTRAAAADAAEQGDVLRRALEDGSPAKRPNNTRSTTTDKALLAATMSVGLEGGLLLSDLRMKVLVADCGVEFVTSDSPVVFHNHWSANAPGTGAFASRGLLVFMPLDPRHMLLMFDTDVYAVGSAEVDYLTVRDPAEIRAMNSLQVEAADEVIIYANPSSALELDALRDVPRGMPGWLVETPRGTRAADADRVSAVKAGSARRLVSGGAIRLTSEAGAVPLRGRDGWRDEARRLWRALDERAERRGRHRRRVSR